MANNNTSMYPARCSCASRSDGTYLLPTANNCWLYYPTLTWHLLVAGGPNTDPKNLATGVQHGERQRGDHWRED